MKCRLCSEKLDDVKCRLYFNICIPKTLRIHWYPGFIRSICRNFEYFPPMRNTAGWKNTKNDPKSMCTTRRASKKGDDQILLIILKIVGHCILKWRRNSLWVYSRIIELWMEVVLSIIRKPPNNNWLKYCGSRMVPCGTPNKHLAYKSQ